MNTRQTGSWAVLLVLATCWAATNAQSYGELQLPFGQVLAEHISSDPPAVKYCANGDRCCVHNESPADCASTASRNRGCRSDSSCVPAADPCKQASNEKGCTAIGAFCKFDINTFTCKLDNAQHPCSAVTSTGSCQAASGCRVQHVCRDSCSACPSCLDAMKAFAKMPSVLRQLERNSAGGAAVFQATAFLTGYCHAAAEGILKASQDDLMAGCARVAEDVARSPALLSRPAALCKRLSLCHSNCLADGTSNTSSSTGSSGSGTVPVLTPITAKDSIDLCSSTGLASGAKGERAINRTNVREGSVCLSSSDCPSGMDCDTFSDSRCWPKCDKATGMDTCLTAGQCVDICQRPDIKAVVDDSQRRYRPCDSPSTCSMGEECREPQFACTMVQCNAHAISKGVNPLEFVPCPKICMAATPRMVNASFTDTGDKIQVTLNQEAAPMNALCSFVFDEQTSSLLGDASTCTTEGNVLTIWLAGDVKIRPNSQPLALGEVNALFTSAFGVGNVDGPPMFTGSLPKVAPCSNCSASALDVKLMGPNEIAMGCEGDPSSAFADVDTTFMRDAPFAPLGSAGFNYVVLPPSSDLWMIQDLKWTVSSSANVSLATMKGLVVGINNKTQNWDRQILSIPFEALRQMPEGPVTLSVDVTNIFGVESTAAVTFKKKNATEAPLFQLDHSLRTFFPSGGFRVDADPLPSACPNAKVSFKWTSTIPNVDLSDATSSSVVLSPRDLLGNVEIGKAYTVTLTATYEGSSGTHSESLTLTAAGSPLSVNLTGPSGTIPLKGSELVYDGQGSVDPDDPFNTGSQMSFMWSCVNTLDLTPCMGKQQEGKYVLNSAQLQEGVRYVVSLTIAKGDRSATASRSIIPGSAKQGMSAEVRRSCGVDVLSGAHLPCPSLHNPTDPLTLIAVPEFEPPFGLEDMLLEWWYDPIAVPDMQLDENNTASGLNLPSLTVLPDAIPNGGAITINVNFSLNPLSPKLKDDGPMPQNFSGTSSLTVPLNGPPYCSSSSGECLTIDRSIATTPDAHFKACAVAWADPEKNPITYDFGTLSALREQKAVATNVPGSCFTFASLPPGPSTLYACAVDSMGARTCQEVDVAVLEPEKPVSPADVDEQLNRLNAELDSQGNATAPATSLVNKAMEVTSLLTSTTKQAVNSVADIVDTTVNSFKSVYEDLKKAFGGFTLSVNAGPSTPERGMRRAVPKLLMSSSAPSALSAASSTALPAKTAIAAANATTKLLRMMADAGCEKDADQSLALLTAGEQLSSQAPMTPQGGVALLNIAKTAMVASSNANRPLNPQQSNTIANALTRGLGAATTAQALQQQQQQQQRRLLASSNPTKPGMVLLSPEQAFSIIEDGAYRLAAAQKVTAGVVEPTVGNAGVCTGPALLSRKDVDGFTTEFDCQGIDATATVVLPSNFSKNCEDNPDCLAADDLLVMTTYFSPASRSVPIVMAVVNNSDHLLAEDPSIKTEVVSGLVNVSLSYSGPAGAFCAGDTIADALALGASCKAELELPLTKAFDAGKTAACVQLLPDPEAPGRLKPGAIEPVLSIRDVEVPLVSGRTYHKASRAKKAVASCKVARQGMWVVAQFDAIDAADEEHMSSQLTNALGVTLGSYELIPGQFSHEDAAVNKKAAVTFTYTFPRDAEAVTGSPVELARFKAELQRAFLAGAVEAWTDGPDLADSLGALRLAHVSVSDIRTNHNNNLVADITLLPPYSTSQEQLAQFLLLPPAELLLSSSSLRKDLITGERSTTVAVSAPSAPKKLLSGDAIIGVVIGCVGVLASILAAIVVVVRRRATVRACISHCSSDDSEAQARQALSTAGGAPSDLRSVTVTESAGGVPPLLTPQASKLSEAASLAEAAASALKNCGSVDGEAGGSCTGEAARLASAAAAALASASNTSKDDGRKGANL